MSLLPLLSVNVHRFFVRPYVPSGAATYPNSKYTVLSSNIFDGDGTFPVYLYFSYSYRQDVQLPFFGRRHTNGQKWTYLHIYVHHRQQLLHSQGSLISPCYLSQS